MDEVNINLVLGEGDGIFELEEDRSLTGMSRVSIKLLDDDLLTNPQYSLEVSLIFIYANLIIKIGNREMWVLFSLLCIFVILTGKKYDNNRKKNQLLQWHMISKSVNYQSLCGKYEIQN